MRKLALLIAVVFVSCTDRKVETWYVYLNTRTNVCKVQRPEERPLFGRQHLGPFKDAKEATKAMCKDVDPEKEDPNRCWQPQPGDACNQSIFLNHKMIKS